MNMDKFKHRDLLRGSRNFFLVDIGTLENADDWAEYLDSILHGDCYILEEGGELILVEQRRLVDVVRGLKIEIYFNEHPPPHFHVKSANIDASFRIENCNLLNGNISRKDQLAVRYWWKHAKTNLIDVWNQARPTDCLVGRYEENT